MGRTEYRALNCRTALNRVEGMPFRWSLNPYRGCAHACRYCYARATHSYFDLGIGRDFEEIIFVKENLPEVLRAELHRSRWTGESVAIGTATDPYQRAEGRFRITRRCLEVLAEAGNPCSITTKGTLIVRDIDVLSTLRMASHVSVHVSLITLDEEIWRRVEPGAPSPRSRLRAIDKLSAAGIPVRVFLMPVLPGLTDRPSQIEAVMRASADAGAVGVTTGALRLAREIKPWFLEFLRGEFPSLAVTYEAAYSGSANLSPLYAKQLTSRSNAVAEGITFRETARPDAPAMAGRQYLLPLGV